MEARGWVGSGRPGLLVELWLDPMSMASRQLRSFFSFFISFITIL
jgi:hypothetical protein